jgi:hypothetical protein
VQIRLPATPVLQQKSRLDVLRLLEDQVGSNVRHCLNEDVAQVRDLLQGIAEGAVREIMYRGTIK